MKRLQLNVRMSTEESKRLLRMCKHYGLGGAAVLRMLLKRDEAAVFESTEGVKRELVIREAMRTVCKHCRRRKEAHNREEECPNNSGKMYEAHGAGT